MLSFDKDRTSDIIFLCLCVTAVFAVLWTFTAQWPWKAQPYNSYILQTQSWLEGRLDLGKDIPYLELAIYNGKYFVSFPPFPSYVMLPFVLIGFTSCDSMLAYAFSLAGAVYAYKILSHFGIKRNTAMFFTLFLTVGSNWLMTAQNSWVWFIAQNMAFTLCLMAIYYALKNKIGLSLALWACAVGCRPLQALYLPVLIYLMYSAHKTENPDDSIAAIIKKRWTSLIPMAVIALSYMILNFARFKNPLEFGHNYLPEFTRVEEGQFSLSYAAKNLASLFRLPHIKDGKFEYPAADGMCIFMVSPILISYFVYAARMFVKKEKKDLKLIAAAFILAVIEIFAITAHKTMGGSHFGNRYINDILPFVFLSLAVMLPKDDNIIKFNYPLFFAGLTLNILGTVSYFI